MIIDIYGRLLIDMVSGEYLCLYARSRSSRNFIKNKKVSSAGQNTISQSSLLQMPIALPSYEEQLFIVSEIQKIFSIVDDFDEAIRIELQKSEILRQSILKKAFSGELVEQDPNDEPASALLERIKTEKSKKRDEK